MDIYGKEDQSCSGQIGCPDLLRQHVFCVGWISESPGLPVAPSTSSAWSMERGLSEASVDLGMTWKIWFKPFSLVLRVFSKGVFLIIS